MELIETGPAPPRRCQPPCGNCSAAHIYPHVSACAAIRQGPPHEVGALPSSLSVVTSQVGLLMVPATQSRGDRDTGREPGTRPGPEPLWVHEACSLNPVYQVRATPRGAAWSRLGSWSAGGSSVGPPAAGTPARPWNCPGGCNSGQVGGQDGRQALHSARPRPHNERLWKHHPGADAVGG